MTDCMISETHASYLHIEDGSLKIHSPVEWNHEFELGVHLQGLNKPSTRCNIQFRPMSHITAHRLEWIPDGAILHFHKATINPVHIGQIFVQLTWQPFTQKGLLKNNANMITFHL